MVDFLLIHGMNVGAWEWERVVPALQADARVGKVVAPDMPGRGANRPGDYERIGIADYLDTALSALRGRDLRDTIVVGHSGGGVCLQALAAAEPERVRQIVFLCAAIPRRGESLLDWQPAPLRLLSRAVLWLLRAKQRGMRANRRLAKRGMCADLEPADCESLLDRLVPEPPALLTEPLTWDVARVQAPTMYMCTTRDRVVRPKDQRRMAHSVPGITIAEMECGHVYPVAYPQGLVATLLGLL